MEKALDADTIVAIAMNNAPLPLLNGYPARLVVPGWTGTYWMKHLTSIEVSSQAADEFLDEDGLSRSGRDVSGEPSVPVAGHRNHRSNHRMVVNSLIADPLEGDEVERSGFTHPWRRVGSRHGDQPRRGVARWRPQLAGCAAGPAAGSLCISPVQSADRTDAPPGTYRLVCRATSQTGEQQAEALKANPGGYHNNVPLPVTRGGAMRSLLLALLAGAGLARCAGRGCDRCH